QLAIPAGEPLGRLLIQAGQQKLTKVLRDFHGTPGPKIIMQSALSSDSYFSPFSDSYNSPL
ncbi:MAG: hypothetical protein WBL39_04610, partial [Terrimicrobiaceae bacterium]